MGPITESELAEIEERIAARRAIVEPIARAIVKTAFVVCTAVAVMMFGLLAARWPQ